MAGNDERLTLDPAATVVDGHLHLLDDDGARYRVPVDDELRAAVRHSRPGPGSASPPSAGPEEATMDTSLRPRDIQARIRAGATAEEVAEASGTALERVLVYARPVLAERAHMAQRAQRSSVRRTAGGEPSGHRTLGDAVAQRLRQIDEDPAGVEWDSRKREDGRWVLTASYTTGEASGLGRFTFDPPGNFVTLDDDDARWLVGYGSPGPDADAVEVETEPSEDTASMAPRLVAVADGELPLGGDALRLVEPTTYDDSQESTADLTDTAEQLRVSGADEPAASATAEDAPEPAVRPEAETTTEPEDEAEDGQPTRRRGKGKRGRASVPSWDEIMFGGGRRE